MLFLFHARPVHGVILDVEQAAIDHLHSQDW